MHLIQLHDRLTSFLCPAPSWPANNRCLEVIIVTVAQQLHVPKQFGSLRFLPLTPLYVCMFVCISNHETPNALAYNQPYTPLSMCLPLLAHLVACQDLLDPSIFCFSPKCKPPLNASPRSSKKIISCAGLRSGLGCRRAQLNCPRQESLPI